MKALLSRKRKKTRPFGTPSKHDYTIPRKTTSEIVKRSSVPQEATLDKPVLRTKTLRNTKGECCGDVREFSNANAQGLERMKIMQKNK